MTWQESEYESETHVPRPHFRFGPRLTPTVKTLIILNVIIFVLEVILDRTGFFYYLSVVPVLVFRRLFLWQLVTYMFLHGGVLHILFNMFALYMFGSDLEVHLGRRRFLQLYFISGIGAGLCHAVASWGSPIPMLGASGAVCGVLVAFAMLFPNRYITLFIYLFPLTLKAKHLVLGFAAIQILSVLSASRSEVAHLAHLGGLVFGYAFMKWRYRLALPFAFSQRFSDNLKRRWHWRKPARYKYKPIDVDEFISEEVDPILAKISREGIGSLTRKEKKILKKARSQMK
jgi:membrane associated rhomboid family serine protease